MSRPGAPSGVQQPGVHPWLTPGRSADGRSCAPGCRCYSPPRGTVPTEGGATDGWLFEQINGLAGQHRYADGLIKAFALFGPYLLAGLFVMLWFEPAPREQRTRVQKAALIAAAAAVLAVALCEVVALAWPRARPFSQHPATLLLHVDAGSSFPSPQAAAGFALATVLVLAEWRVGCWALACAALVGLSRVVAGDQYVTDVLAGGLLGTAVGAGLYALRSRFDPVLDRVLATLRRVRLA